MIFEGKHEGDLVITENGEVNGTVTGDVTVSEKCTVVIRGIVEGSLTVKKFAVVDIHGVVNSRTINDGGVITASDGGALRGGITIKSGDFYIGMRPGEYQE